MQGATQRGAEGWGNGLKAEARRLSPVLEEVSSRRQKHLEPEVVREKIHRASGRLRGRSATKRVAERYSTGNDQGTSNI